MCLCHQLTSKFDRAVSQGSEIERRSRNGLSSVLFQFWKAVVPQEDHCFGWMTLAGSECPFSARRRIKRRVYHFVDDRVRIVLWEYRLGCAEGGCNCWWKREEGPRACSLHCLLPSHKVEKPHEHSVREKQLCHFVRSL